MSYTWPYVPIRDIFIRTRVFSLAHMLRKCHYLLCFSNISPSCKWVQLLCTCNAVIRVFERQHLYHSLYPASRGTEWNASIAFGNPAAAPEVKLHLKSVQTEQARALVTPKQAVPLLLDKIVLISRHIEYELHNPNISNVQKYLFARDKSYFNWFVILVTGHLIWESCNARNYSGFLIRKEFYSVWQSVKCERVTQTVSRDRGNLQCWDRSNGNCARLQI